MSPEPARVRFAGNPYRQADVPAQTLPAAVDDPQAFHRTLAGYAPTPLVSLPALAGELGIGELWIISEGATDPESYRRIVGAEP